MTVWDKDALSAPHSEREMGQIEGGGFITIRDCWPSPDEADAPVSAVPAEGVERRLLGARRKAEALMGAFDMRGANRATMQRLIAVCEDAAAALRAQQPAPAEREAKPVAWIEREVMDELLSGSVALRHTWLSRINGDTFLSPIYAHPTAPQPVAVDCPCTLIEQDEYCPVGHPSSLCGVCDGKGITTPEKMAALAAEMLRIASDLGEPEDPFAAWEKMSATPAAQVTGGVEVKPLEWSGKSDPDYDRANCAVGRYEIINSFQDCGFMLQVPGINRATYHPTLEAAKGAAQADYEVRIRAALTGGAAQ